jgi:hypothetical protein
MHVLCLASWEVATSKPTNIEVRRVASDHKWFAQLIPHQALSKCSKHLKQNRLGFAKG